MIHAEQIINFSHDTPAWRIPGLPTPPVTADQLADHNPLTLDIYPALAHLKGRPERIMAHLLLATEVVDTPNVPSLLKATFDAAEQQAPNLAPRSDNKAYTRMREVMELAEDIRPSFVISSGARKDIRHTLHGEQHIAPIATILACLWAHDGEIASGLIPAYKRNGGTFYPTRVAIMHNLLTEGPTTIKLTEEFATVSSESVRQIFSELIDAGIVFRQMLRNTSIAAMEYALTEEGELAVSALLRHIYSLDSASYISDLAKAGKALSQDKPAWKRFAQAATASLLKS